MGGQKSIQLGWPARSLPKTTQGERDTTRHNRTLPSRRTSPELDGLLPPTAPSQHRAAESTVHARPINWASHLALRPRWTASCLRSRCITDGILPPFKLTFVQRDLHEPHTVTFGPPPGDPNNPLSGVFPSGTGNPNAFDGTSALNSGFLFHKSQYDYWRLGLTPIAAAVPRTEFSLTFTTPGSYNFYCLLHGGIDPATGAVFGMSGTVTVLPREEDDRGSG